MEQQMTVRIKLSDVDVWPFSEDLTLVTVMILVTLAFLAGFFVAQV